MIIHFYPAGHSCDGMVSGPVIEVVNGALTVNIGLRGFLPASWLWTKRGPRLFGCDFDRFVAFEPMAGPEHDQYAGVFGGVGGNERGMHGAFGDEHDIAGLSETPST